MTHFTGNPDFPLQPASLSELGFYEPALHRLRTVIGEHIAGGCYPGAQIALARHGRMALFETSGLATTATAAAATNQTLWLLFSNTKVITAAGMWALIEEGAATFSDRVSDHLPEFSRHGKGDITIAQVLSHRAGFPSQGVTSDAWTDHGKMLRQVCDFTLEWTPGSRVHYHSRSAFWTIAALIEVITKGDYRNFLRKRIIEPLGLGADIYIGLPDTEHGRVATIYEPVAADGSQQPLDEQNSAAYRRAGVPSGGGYGTARGMVALYQMLAQHGQLNGRRYFSRRLIEFVTRNHTGDMIDYGMGMPMHRGMGVHVRGKTDTIRGLGTIAFPGTFGHGGVGSSYCWADPDASVSFAYITNSRIPDPWHSRRLDIIANLVHSAIC